MKRRHILLILLLHYAVFGCDWNGGGSGSDESQPITQTPADPQEPSDPRTPTEPKEPTQIELEPLHQPTLVESHWVEPARQNTYQHNPLENLSQIQLNDKGVYAGTSDSRAWLVTSAGPREIGLCCDSSVVSLTDSGYVIGNNLESHWLEEPDLERIRITEMSTTWLNQNAINTSLGLDTLSGISTNNHRSHAINESGQVIGTSAYYPDRCVTYLEIWGDDFSICDPSEETAHTAWLYTEGSYLTVGLSSNPTDGAVDIPAAINGAGDVAGSTADTCWIHSEGMTESIATGDNELPVLEGLETDCRIAQLNEAGQVIGNTSITHDSFRSSYYAWLFSGESTQIIGLYDDEHLDEEERTWNNATLLNARGDVAGTASRYLPASGTSAWLYSGGKTTNVSLRGSEHIPSIGWGRSEIIELNNLGQVTGISTRYGQTASGTTVMVGETAWFYDGGTHVRLGITDEAHTDIDGTNESMPLAIDQSGNVVGYSRRFPAMEGPEPCRVFCMSQSVWFYDNTNDKIYPIQVSTRSDGYTYSEVLGIRGDGVLVGYFMDFNESDNYEWNVFTFSVENGLQVSLLEGFNPVSIRSTPRSFNDAGYFIGAGRLFAPITE